MEMLVHVITASMRVECCGATPFETIEKKARTSMRVQTICVAWQGQRNILMLARQPKIIARKIVYGLSNELWTLIEIRMREADSSDMWRPGIAALFFKAMWQI